MSAFNDRYTVLSRLGDGAQAKVFRCMDEYTCTEVCIKVYLFSDSTELNHAMNESLIIKSLRHPNIIRVIECFVIEDHEFLGSGLCQVMPFYPYGDLQKYIDERKNNPIDEEVVQHIIKQLVSALGVVHAKKIIHRDVKPANILIDCFDKDKLPKIILADFGLSRKAQDNTAQYSMVGTSFFMAPELFNLSAYSWSADIYSVGVVMYFLMTRQVCNTYL